MAISKMKKVTKNNLLTYIEWKKQAIKNKENNLQDNELLEKLNSFTVDVINQDKNFFKKVTEYQFNKNQLDYLLH